MFELSFSSVFLLVITGLLAGIINTLAGGGSNLTLPALMLMGMPADIANATNRVGVLLQSLVAVKGFQSQGKLSAKGLTEILLITLIGGALGAALASYMPVWLLKPLLLSAMIGMALLILLKPGTIIPEVGSEPFSVRERPLSVLALFLAGFYGGFVQAGVGFILLAALAGSLRFDLVRANALKVVCTGAFTAVALVVFVARDQVVWLPGLILACGTMVGAYFGVKMAISVSQQLLKWFLLLMTVFASAAAMWF